MSTIQRLQWLGLRIPFQLPFATARSTIRHRYALLVWLTTNDGLVGVGEASPLQFDEEAKLQELDQRIRQITSHLVGVDLTKALDSLGILTKGFPILHFGLETAVFDLLGKRTGRPLTVLLGGIPQQIKVNATVGTRDIEQAALLISEALIAGISTIKLKVGGRSVANDQALVKKARDVVGDDLTLRVDANGGWSVDAAIRNIRLLEPFGLEYVEQPVGSIISMARVRQEVNTPIAVDESVTNIDDARLVFDMNAADVLVVKGANLGGLVQAKNVVQLAFDANRSAVVTSSMETGIGLAASLHLAGILPSGGPACGLATGTLLEHDLLNEPIRVENGELAIPRGPGLGVEVDFDALNKYSIGLKGDSAT